MAIKLVIADVDDTLLTPEKALTPETIRAVERLRAAGIRFTVTSGRPPRGLASLIGPLKLTAPIAGFNGGMYMLPDLKTLLSQRTIAPAIARRIVGEFMDHGFDVWVYRGADWLLRDAGAFRVDRERSNVGFDPVVVDDLHECLDGVVKIVGINQDRDRLGPMEADLNERFGDEVFAARSASYYVDVTHPEANKGMVVRQAARILRLPLEEVAAVGDQINDIPMLKVAGMGIAMGNAKEEVRRHARHVSKSNREEGFAHAVDTFILGNAQVARSGLGLPAHTRACLFALDGVLTQAAHLQAKAWKALFDPHLQEHARMANEAFVPFDEVHDYARFFDGKKPLEDVRAFLASRNIEVPERTLRALTDKKAQLFSHLLSREHLETFEGSIRFVRAAHDAGIKTAVVSSRGDSAGTLESAGLSHLFDVQIDTGAPEEAGGHLRDGYVAAAEALGVPTEDAVVFEDDLSGVEAACKDHFGMVIAVDRAGRSEDYRRHGADLVVTDLGSLLNTEVANPRSL